MIAETAAALKDEGIPKPWRLAFDICVKRRFLPHRTYLMIDDGDDFKLLLQWNIGPYKIWRARKPKSI
jgi:hypothetical protein